MIFNNNEFGEIRTLSIDGEPWFVGKDVAEALGYGNGNNSSKALTNAISDHVDYEDKKHISYEDLKGYQNGDLKNFSHYGAIFINESGVYALIFGSKLPSAKKFKRWVTSEVLPALRRTGSYSVNKVPPVKNVRDVVSYIRLVQETAEKNGATPQEMAEIVNSMSEQFGVKLPECFNRGVTLNEVYDMIDYIFSCPRGRGHRLPTYEDWIASRTVKTSRSLSN